MPGQLVSRQRVRKNIQKMRKTKEKERAGGKKYKMNTVCLVADNVFAKKIKYK